MTDSSKTSREFIVESAGPDGLYGVFEDDGDTGYLYIYEPDGMGIRSHLHIYNRSSEPEMFEKDIEVNWSKDGGECIVSVRGIHRGAINLTRSN